MNRWQTWFYSTCRLGSGVGTWCCAATRAQRHRGHVLVQVIGHVTSNSEDGKANDELFSRVIFPPPTSTNICRSVSCFTFLFFFYLFLAGEQCYRVALLYLYLVLVQYYQYCTVLVNHQVRSTGSAQSLRHVRPVALFFFAIINSRVARRHRTSSCSIATKANRGGRAVCRAREREGWRCYASPTVPARTWR